MSALFSPSPTYREAAEVGGGWVGYDTSPMSSITDILIIVTVDLGHVRTGQTPVGKAPAPGYSYFATEGWGPAMDHTCV